MEMNKLWNWKSELKQKVLARMYNHSFDKLSNIRRKYPKKTQWGVKEESNHHLPHYPGCKLGACSSISRTYVYNTKFRLSYTRTKMIHARARTHVNTHIWNSLTYAHTKQLIILRYNMVLHLFDCLPLGQTERQNWLRPNETRRQYSVCVCVRTRVCAGGGEGVISSLVIGSQRPVDHTWSPKD